MIGQWSTSLRAQNAETHKLLSQIVAPSSAAEPETPRASSSRLGPATSSMRKRAAPSEELLPVKKLHLSVPATAPARSRAVPAVEVTSPSLTGRKTRAASRGKGRGGRARGGRTVRDGTSSAQSGGETDFSLA